MRLLALAAATLALAITLSGVPAGSSTQILYMYGNTILVYQEKIGDTTYTIAVAPDGTVVENSTNSTITLARAAAWASSHGFDIVIAPGTYHLWPVSTTPGLYKYPYALWINGSGVHVYAHHDAVLVFHGEASIILGSDILGERIVDVGWHGGTIDGSQAEYSKSRGVIVVFQADHYTITDTRITGAPIHGIHILIQSRYGKITWNTLEQVQYQAISLDGADHTLVAYNTIIDARAAINLQVNSDIEARGHDGVPEHNTITANTITAAAAGIVISGGAHNTITANTIQIDRHKTPETYGIRLGPYYNPTLDKAWPPHHNTITANTITGPHYAIAITGYPGKANATHNIIQANTINNAQYTLLIKHAEHNIIADNPANTTHGIKIGPGTNNNIIHQHLHNTL